MKIAINFEGRGRVVMTDRPESTPLSLTLSPLDLRIGQGVDWSDVDQLKALRAVIEDRNDSELRQILLEMSDIYPRPSPMRGGVYKQRGGLVFECLPIPEVEAGEDGIKVVSESRFRLRKGFEFWLADDQDSAADDAVEWSVREGIGRELAGLALWLGSSSELNYSVLSAIARQILDGERTDDGRKKEAIASLTPRLMIRFERLFSALSTFSRWPEAAEYLRSTVAKELARCGSKDSQGALSCSEPEKLWSCDERGIPWAAEALALAWWENEEREAWESVKRRIPGLTHSKLKVLEGITGPKKAWRGDHESRDVFKAEDESSIDIRYEGDTVSTAPIQGIDADKLVMLADAFVDEMAIRLGVEFLRIGTDPRAWPKIGGRARFEFTASELLSAIGFRKDEKTASRLNDILRAGSHYTYTIETVGKHRTETISGSFWDLKTVRYHDQGRRGEDRIIVSLGEFFNPAVGMGSLYVPAPNPPPLDFLHQKIRHKGARLATFIIPREMTDRAKEIALKGGMLFGQSEAEKFGRKVGMSAGKVIEAVNKLVEAGMFELTDDGRLSFAENESYGMFRADLIAKGQRMIAGKERAKDRAQKSEAKRKRWLKKASDRSGKRA